MKKYTNRKRVEVNEYKVGDLVMLSTKDLKYQMVRRRTEKLTKRFIDPYKIQKIVLSNTVNVRGHLEASQNTLVVSGGGILS